MAGDTSLRGGYLPIEDGFDLAEVCGFIVKENQCIKIKDSGKKIVALWNKDEPNLMVIRKIIFSLIIKLLPPWTAFINMPIPQILESIPGNWFEVLGQADVIHFPLSSEAVQWWEELRDALEKIEEDIRKSTGKIGEKLTIEYEKKRLHKDNCPHLIEGIKWMARISDKYGYDIQSYFGFLHFYNNKQENILMIEVKSSTYDSDDFRFFLTRTEWETAKKNSKSYLFYLWRGVNSGKKEVKPEGPFVFSVDFIRKYIPINQHKDGRWEKCRIIINIKKTKDKLIFP